MSGKRLWLVVAIWCGLLGALVVGAGLFGGSSSTAQADVDLEAVLAEYKLHAGSGAEDLSAFEQRINDKKLYEGEGRVSVVFEGDGSVVGFVDKDADGKRGTADALVFKIEADKARSQLIASDRHDRHYRMGMPNLLTFYLVSSMFSRHHRYYGGWHSYGYRTYAPRGYYRGVRTSSRFGSRWGRGGSGGRGGRGGGWRGGK